MHRGTVLAGMMIGLVAVIAGTWLMLDPLFVRTYDAELRNPRTGERERCFASFAHGFGESRDSESAVATCISACGERGFVQVGGNTTLVIDYASAAGYRRAKDKWRAFIPEACRA